MSSTAKLSLLGLLAVLAGGVLMLRPANPVGPLAKPGSSQPTQRLETAQPPQEMPQPVPSASPSAFTPPLKRGKPPALDPAARVALSLVGTDPTAELIWLDAINNPHLSAQERQDLIEDLNEDGLTNKKQPAPTDLPLIQARITLIDRLMPDAMDQTNAAAFAEARKDLINLQAKLRR